MKKIFLMLILLLCLVGCSNENDVPASKELDAMDTTMSLTAYGSNAERALEEASDEIARLDKCFSISASSGDIWTLNNKKSATLSTDTATLLARAIEISGDTGGAFDPTIAPLMEAWSFTDKNYRVPSTATIQSLLAAVDAGAIKLDADGHCSIPQNVSVDLGAIAKGYTANRIMEIFSAHHVDHALISLGGNVQTLGTKPDSSAWRVGIQDPKQPNDIIATVEVGECAVVTSGGYLRYFEENGVRYHHIIDPHTGYPANNGLLSVTIVTDDGTLADALSTALFVMGEADAIRYWRTHSKDFECILVSDDGRILATPSIATTLTLSSGEKPEVIA